MENLELINILNKILQEVRQIDANTTRYIIDLNTIISALIGLFGAVFGAWLGRKGALEAVTKQIAEERNRINAEKTEKIKNAKYAIENIIENEIRYNIDKVIGGIDGAFITRILEKARDDSNCIYNFEYKEWDKLKYDLIGYSSQEIKDIFLIYNALNVIQRRQRLRDFSDKEYEEIHVGIKKCKENYY